MLELIAPAKGMIYVNVNVYSLHEAVCPESFACIFIVTAVHI